MEQWNQMVFLLLNAKLDALAADIEFAKFIAEDLICVVPFVLLITGLRGVLAKGRVAYLPMIGAAMSGLLGLIFNYFISLAWYHPRPLEMGIGQTLIAHVQDSSFPSNHLTLIWSVALSLLLHKQHRVMGGLLFLIGIPVAWARIYLGVHFPLDIVGAAIVGMVSASLIWYLESCLKPKDSEVK
jgi:undecaprenyl-diphosphatase